MNVTLNELLMAVREADRVLLAVHDTDGFVRGYARTSKRGIRRAFREDVETMKSQYEISWSGKDLLIQ